MPSGLLFLGTIFWEVFLCLLGYYSPVSLPKGFVREREQGSHDYCCLVNFVSFYLFPCAGSFGSFLAQIRWPASCGMCIGLLLTTAPSELQVLVVEDGLIAIVKEKLFCGVCDFAYCSVDWMDDIISFICHSLKHFQYTNI